MNRTGCIRKYVVRVATDQAYRTNHQHQNNGQHYRILGDVLALLVRPQLAKKPIHVRASVLSDSSSYVRPFCLRGCGFWCSLVKVTYEERQQNQAAGRLTLGLGGFHLLHQSGREAFYLLRLGFSLPADLLQSLLVSLDLRSESYFHGGVKPSVREV